MARATYPTIVLKGDLENEETGFAAEAGIKAGMLIEMDANGEFVSHITSGGYGEGHVVKEPDWDGGTVDSVINDNDEFKFHKCQLGDHVALWLAILQTITINENLMSDGAGRVISATGAGHYVMFKALEAVTTDGVTPKQIRARYVGNIYVP